MGLLRSLVRPRSGTKIRVRVLIKGRIGAGWHDVDRTFRLAPGATLAELLPAADRAGVPLSEAISNSPHLRDTLMINGERCPLEDNRDRELHEGDEIYLLAPVAGGSGGTWEKDSFEGRLDRVLRREIDGCERLASIERLSGGASQETYRLRIETEAGERQFALRRSQGGLAEEARAVERSAPGLRIEAKLMQVARRNGIPEPEVFYVLEPGDELGAGFIMEWLDGVALGARIVRSPDLAEVRPKLARQCGEILGRLHTIELEAHGLDRDLASLSAADFIEQTRGRYEALDTPQPMIDFTARWLMENLPASPDRTLVHNDFRNGNLMVDQTGVSAVLDWEIAHIGDPMRDLGWICTNSWRYGAGPELPVGGFGTYEDLFAGYEATSGKTVDLRPGAVLGGVRLLLVGRFDARHDPALPSGAGPFGRTRDNRTPHHGVSGRLRESADPRSGLAGRRAQRPPGPGHATARGTRRRDPRLPARSGAGRRRPDEPAFTPSSPATRSTSSTGTCASAAEHRRREHERLKRPARHRRAAAGAALEARSRHPGRPDRPRRRAAPRTPASHRR